MDEAYWNLRDALIQAELLVLRMLRFNTEFEHPHKVGAWRRVVVADVVGKVGILAVFWSFWGPEYYILFQENFLPVFRSLSNPKSLALGALDFVHSSTPNH